MWTIIRTQLSVLMLSIALALVVLVFFLAVQPAARPGTGVVPRASVDAPPASSQIEARRIISPSVRIDWRLALAADGRG